MRTHWTTLGWEQRVAFLLVCDSPSTASRWRLGLPSLLLLLMVPLINISGLWCHRGLPVFPPPSCSSFPSGKACRRQFSQAQRELSENNSPSCAGFLWIASFFLSLSEVVLLWRCLADLCLLPQTFASPAQGRGQAACGSHLCSPYVSCPEGPRPACAKVFGLQHS